MMNQIKDTNDIEIRHFKPLYEWIAFLDSPGQHCVCGRLIVYVWEELYGASWNIFIKSSGAWIKGGRESDLKTAKKVAIEEAIDRN